MTIDNAKILFSEIVSSKLLHDISGPISAIVNGIECLDIKDNNKEELDELNLYGNSIINSVRVMRQAYAFSDDNSSIQKTFENITNYFKYKNSSIKFDYILKNKIPNESNIFSFIKILVNVLLYILSHINKLQSTIVTIDYENNTIKTNIEIKAYTISTISFENKKTEVQIEDFQRNFIANLLEIYKVKHSCSKNDSSINILLEYFIN